MQFHTHPQTLSHTLPCRLSRQELLAVASDAALIRAYHTHAAPLELLGWEQDQGDALAPPATL